MVTEKEFADASRRIGDNRHNRDFDAALNRALEIAVKGDLSAY